MGRIRAANTASRMRDVTAIAKQQVHAQIDRNVKQCTHNMVEAAQLITGILIW
jgi:predicted RNase H-related nuclease YkuK (DUF458 family)